MNKIISKAIQVIPFDTQVALEKLCCQLIRKIFSKVTIKYRGYRIEMPGSDKAATSIYFRYLITGQWRHEIFEQSQIERLIRKILPNCIFIDGGANYGMYAFLAASLAEVEHVYAIEASQKTYQYLLDNVVGNSLPKKITCLNRAISNSSGEHVFITNSANSEWNSVHSKPNRNTDAQEILSLALDDLIFDVNNSQKHSFLVKLDLEGYEPKAMQGLVRLFDSDRRFIIFLELHAGILNRTTGGAAEFVRQIWALQPGTVMEMDNGKKQLIRFNTQEEFLDRVDYLSPQKFPGNLTNILLFSSNIDIPDNI